MARLSMLGAFAAAASACTPSTGPVLGNAPTEPLYEILIDERRPAQAEVHLALPSVPVRLMTARGGDVAGIGAVHCEDGRPAKRDGEAWLVPPGCVRVAWTVVIDDIDATGIDASLPIAAYSRRHGYWLLPERDSLLRADDRGGSAVVRLRLVDGRSIERRYAFPSNDQPPFYAVIGFRPAREHVGSDFALRVVGAPPDYPWMGAIHRHVLASWSAWRRDLVAGSAPAMIDWAWVRPSAGAEPGYTASAGAEAIVSQIVLRDGDPDAEAKARVVIATSAAHEGFHTITGAAGQAWPAWVNESLASHYAIEAARGFLQPEDRPWLDAFYLDPEVRAPLLDAQARYSAGDGEQAQVFYTWGARFWREIEKVLTNPPNRSGRLAALLRATNNFSGTDLVNADAIAALLDRHSDGRAQPIVRCFLQGAACPTMPSRTAAPGSLD